MESFSGLAILATNMKSALDNAFMRRLRFIITFQFPGPNERKADLAKKHCRPMCPGNRSTTIASPASTCRAQHPQHRPQCRFHGLAARHSGDPAADSVGNP